MCEKQKQKRIEELELENAELYKAIAEIGKLRSESGKLDAEKEKLMVDTMKSIRDIKYQPVLMITPIVVSVIALIAAIAK